MRAIEARLSGVAKQQGPYREVRLDASTHAMLHMTYQHHEVHDGNSYWSGYVKTLANANVMDLAWTTPATPQIHFTLKVTATADATFSLYEGLTSYSGGTALSLRNRYRDSSNTSAITTPVYGATGASVVTLNGGTIIWPEPIDAGKGIHFERSSGEEIILAASTKYAMHILNGANSNTVSLLMEWYEHTPKD